MPAISSTRSSSTNGLPIVKSTPSTNPSTSLSSVLQTPKQSSSQVANSPTGDTTSFPSVSLPSVPVPTSGTHVVTNPMLRPTSSLSLISSLNPTPSLSPTPSLIPTLSSISSMSFPATSTPLPCDTGNLSSACAQPLVSNYLPSASGGSHLTTSRYSSSGTVSTTSHSSSTTTSRHSSSGTAVTTTHFTSTTTSRHASSGTVVPATHSTATTPSVASTETSKSSSYMPSGSSSTPQTTSTILFTTLPITSTATFSPMSYGILPRSSRTHERSSSTPGYSSVSSASVSPNSLTSSSLVGSDSTFIIGGSVGAAAVFCSIAIVALLFHLRSRWRQSNADPHLYPFADNDSTVLLANSPSGGGAKATTEGADGLDSFAELAGSPSGRGTPDSCATNSIMGVWPEEDRSAIARRTRSRELENIYPGPQKHSGGTSVRKREKRGRETHGRRENPGADGSETPTWSIHDRLTFMCRLGTRSREWTNEVIARFGEVRTGTGVVMSGRPSLSSMEPSVRSSPSQNCSPMASRNNVCT
ncbi:hypothetical protein EDD16DRAFT_467836 [Pisolithus croceorrhizus]|nr:hypothetical protein EDD16DRAFT_467836 [Pisolithus croceorrhizus]KAI6106957.1 hypothetical protein EV401DRAFT_470982 [Pisolithus croceorrhizus]KAI6158434.1 hypothetical protein EDD17DRAFT_1007893 [Pisolithus thermaeus]